MGSNDILINAECYLEAFWLVVTGISLFNGSLVSNSAMFKKVIFFCSHLLHSVKFINYLFFYTNSLLNDEQIRRLQIMDNFKLQNCFLLVKAATIAIFFANKNFLWPMRNYDYYLKFVLLSKCWIFKFFFLFLSWNIFVSFAKCYLYLL